MKHSLYISYLLLSTITGYSCQPDPVVPVHQYICWDSTIAGDPQHPHAAKYQGLADEMVAGGAPGVIMSIRKEGEPAWTGAAGKADLKFGEELLPCNITRVGSVVKTFTAVAILLLAEENRIELDDLVSDHLSPAQLRGLENADKATIRQLLQHTSGIHNYIQNLNFQTASLNHLTKIWHPEELLSYSRGQRAQFAVGTNATYSNTNYILLGQIIDSVTGKPFWEFFEERIFLPFQLESTRFAATDPVPNNLIQGYTDIFNNRTVSNSTFFSGWDYFTADGGLISNPYDLALFSEQLFSGKIISWESLNQMLDFYEPSDRDPEGFKTDYGLGTFKIETSQGIAYIHSGDAIGYFATMVYFPEQKTAISWAVNGNYGSIDSITQSREAMEAIFTAVLSE